MILNKCLLAFTLFSAGALCELQGEFEKKDMYGFEGDSETQSDHARAIIKRVIESMDEDKDGRISVQEYIRHELPLLTKREDEAREEEKKKKKKAPKSDSKDQEKIAVKNKRKPSSKKKEALSDENKVFNQKGDEAFIPSKFRA
ncbi:unnamed protein product [Mucor hiemalis]